MSYIGNTPTSQAFAPGTDTFSGTGSQTAFTLSRNVSTVNDIQVVVNNVVQQPSHYTVSGTTLTFSPAPSSGTNNIYVRYLSTNLLTVVPQQGSVFPSSLSKQNALYWDTNSNVGIGTNSPTARLDVVGAAGALTNGIIRSSDGFMSRLTLSNTNRTWTVSNYGTQFGPNGSFNIADETAGLVRFTIDASGNTYFNSGYGTNALAYGCRAWVNFNGTGTVAIRSSGNVTSITDNGVGNYTVNLTTAMPDANYTTVASGSYNDNAINAAQEPWVKVASVTTSTIRIYTHWHVFNVGYTAQDIAYVGLAIFR